MGNKKRKELSETIRDNLRRLKLVDINLQIESAKIREANAVRVIAEDIKGLLMNWQRNLKSLIGR